jgi:hypothetical protein
MIVIQCPYDPPHVHEYPDDWKFGGANGLDPRVDERYAPDTYVYFDRSLRILHLTQVPLCDDQAIDEFTKVASWSKQHDPHWLQVTRHGERNATTLPVVYNKETDEVFDT